jgi:DNA-binding LytR/AlgR family response regulator
MTLACMVVDDEPLARRVLAKHIAEVPSLSLVKECAGAAEAAAYIHTHRVDVIFLDIKMPRLSGLDFLKTLTDPPQIIITTAFSEYAIEGYEYSVVDYLLKPIPFDRFLKAVNKLSVRLNTGEKPRAESDTGRSNFIFIRSGQKSFQVRFDDIDRIQGWGNYVKIFTGTRAFLAPMTMKAVERLLPAERFLRCHKSHIVNRDRIESIGDNRIALAGIKIPVGRAYKQKVDDFLDRFDATRS